jgi:hypothetical protein
MKKTLWSTCLAVLVCVAPFASAAEETKPEAKPEAAPVMTAKEKADFAKQVDLFAQVVSYGETQKDPLALLTAVQMLEDLPFGGVAKADAKDKSTYDRAGLLSLAKQYATGDAELLAVIAKLQDAPEATAVRGRRDRDRDRDDRPGRYYERRHHERRFRCEWYRECHRGRCRWVCEPERRGRY